MVAAAIPDAKPPAIPRKRGTRPANAAWPLVQELAVQTMYLTDGLTPTQIAAALSTPERPLDSNKVRGLIFRRAWFQTKANATRRAQTLAHARATEHVERVVQATAAVAEAASVAGLKRALDATADTGRDAARDFRSWAGGARDLVNVARQARGLVDAGKVQAVESDGRTINLQFFVGNVGASVASGARSGGADTAPSALPGSGGASACDCKTVGPVLDVETRPAS